MVQLRISRQSGLSGPGIPTPRGGPWWRDVLTACAAVTIALAIRMLLENFGQFYYLMLIPAVGVTALLAGRWAVALAIGLSIASDFILVARESVVDGVANATIFSIIAWGIAEVCWRLIAALERSRSLSRTLAVEKALLDTILTSVPVVTLDRNGGVQRITPAAADLLGVTASAAMGEPFSTIVQDFDMAALAEVQKGGSLTPPPSGHWRARHASGQSMPLTLHADILPDDTEPEYAVLSLTDQSQAEATRDRARGLDIQLSHVWRLNSMGELAATLAHELNQPLTAATVYLHAGQSDLARAGLMGESAARSLDLAKTQLLRAGDIIRRTRDLISTGARSLADERFSSMVEDLTPIFALISRDTDVPIRVDIHDADDHVLGDRIQVQQAVANLVRNAVDAVAGTSGGLVAVIGRSMGKAGFELTVEDNGPGIPEDKMDLIFQPTTTTKAGGMGLGLSVTRSIIESHGGQLVVGRSRLGGASFSFRLPRAPEEVS